MRITFWGVRGSVPAPERHTWRYGGNTACVEIHTGDHLFILDAGTGIRDLGRHLLAGLPQLPGLQVNLFLTHYHWDHVQGLPFFEPLYFAGNSVHIYGPRPPFGLKGVMDTLFRSPFFPMPAAQLKASRHLHELAWENDFIVGTTRFRTCRLNHPQGSVAYRLDNGGASVVYATDHEPGKPEFDQALRKLAHDADVFISDAQYLPEEVGGQKAGWGHGSWSGSVSLARDAGVKNLVLFHHEPVRTDIELDDMLFQARQVFPQAWMATEGMLVDVTHRTLRVGSRAGRLSQRALLRVSIQIESSQDGSPVRDEVRLENLSLQGAYLLSPRAYEPQQPVNLAVRLHAGGDSGAQADSNDADLRLRGYVLRTEPQTTNGGWVGVALHFPGNEPPRPLSRSTGASAPSRSPGSVDAD